MLSESLLPVIVRIASYRVQFVVSFLKMEEQVPQLLKKISALSEELGSSPSPQFTLLKIIPEI